MPVAACALVISYLLWACGLSSNLAANWRLLEATGTSTSVLSKAAYEIAGRRGVGVGMRRFLTAAGYVVLELGKEWLYYVGAFGLAIVSAEVSSQDAIVFLAGTNVGAAAYEYALGWSTRALLGRHEPKEYASFEKRLGVGGLSGELLLRHRCRRGEPVDQVVDVRHQPDAEPGPTGRRQVLCSARGESPPELVWGLAHPETLNAIKIDPPNSLRIAPRLRSVTRLRMLQQR
jgi:hypothetical protein